MLPPYHEFRLLDDDYRLYDDANVQVQVSPPTWWRFVKTFFHILYVLNLLRVSPCVHVNYNVEEGGGVALIMHILGLEKIRVMTFKEIFNVEFESRDMELFMRQLLRDHQEMEQSSVHLDHHIYTRQML